MKFTWIERPGRPLLAAASGILLGIAFPKIGLALAAFVALLPLLLALQPPGGRPEDVVAPRAAFQLGYLTGAVFFLILLYWIPRLPRENVTIPFAMYPVLGLMILYLSLYPALAAMTSAFLARRGVPLGLAFPILWTFFEVIRGTGTFGFPWGSVGYALAPAPHLIQFAEYTGLWGVSLWIVLVAGVVHIYLGARWVAPKAAVLSALALLLILPYFHGREVLGKREPRAGVAVGIIQPNIGNNKWQPAVRESVVTAILGHTEALANENRRQPPRLIVWPETAIPARLPREPRYLQRLQALVDSTGIPVLAGFPDGERLPGGKLRFTNSAALVIPGGGIVNRYDKRHLVPFSEYFPLPVLNRVDFGQSNFSAGKEPGVFSDLAVPFGVLICFESIFPGPARELSRNGARYLINITNDQWFGDSAAPIQHFQMNVLRTIENRMGMARVANTGISAVIDPYGFVFDRTATFEPARLVQSVELGRRRPTFYSRWGDWILVVCGVGLAGLWGGAWLRRRGRG